MTVARSSLSLVPSCLSVFSISDTATTEIYTLSLHDALPICIVPGGTVAVRAGFGSGSVPRLPKVRLKRTEAHTSELQSPDQLVCRLRREKTTTVGTAARAERPPSFTARAMVASNEPPLQEGK